MRALSALLCLLVLLDPAAADEKEPAEKLKPLTVEQATEAVQRAFGAKDERVLQALAEKDEPDPWLVADRLCRLGARDAAEAFAKASPRKALERLPAYVLSRPAAALQDEMEKLLEEVKPELEKQVWSRVMELVTAPPTPLDSVVTIRLACGRGYALGALGRTAEAARELTAAGNAARALGWWQRAATALSLAGDAALGAAQAADGSADAYRMAAEALEAAAVALEAVDDKAELAQALWRTGVAHEQAGAPRKALEPLHRAVQLYRTLHDRKGLSYALNSQGVVELKLSDFQAALVSLKESLGLKLELGDDRAAALTRRHLAEVHSHLGMNEEALAQAQATIALAQRLQIPSLEADGLNLAGCALAELGRLRDSLEAHQRSRTLRMAAGDLRRATVELENVASAQSRLGEYRKALESYEDARRAYEGLGDRRAEIVMWRVGQVYTALGDYPRAVEAIQRGVIALDAPGLERESATALSALGAVRLYMGEYAKALADTRRARDVYVRHGDEQAADGLLINAALALTGMGEYAKALTCIEEVSQSAERRQDKRMLATALHGRGNLYKRIGDDPRALRDLRRALDLYEELEGKSGTSGALNDLALVLESVGNDDEALAMYRRALELMEATGERVRATNVRSNIALVYGRQGRYEDALRMHEAALSIYRAVGDKEAEARLLSDIADIHRVQGKTDLARGELDEAVGIARSIRARPVLLTALRRLAAVYIDMGKSGRALLTAQRALDEAEKVLGGHGEEQGALVRQQYGGLFAVGAWAAVLEEMPSEAFLFLESGRAGALLDVLGKRETLRWKAASLPPELLTLDREAHAQADVARAAYDRVVHRKDLKEIRQAGEALDAASDRVREVVARIQRELKAQASLYYPRTEVLGDVQSALTDDQALVIYGLLREAVALVLRRDSARIVRLGPIDDIRQACEALDVGLPTSESATAVSRLRQLLVDRLNVGKEVKQVLVSPEGVLCYLPFALLFDQAVAMTPSGSTHVLLLDQARREGQGVLALGDPDYAGVSEGAQAIYYRGHPLSPLSASRPEVEAIGSRKLLGSEADEAGLRRALGERKRWKAVHFACHGLIDVERPMLSSLALSASGEDADGFLTALEVLRMEVSADLTVLSACETGKGRIVRGEGIVGLMRAFMFAGSPRVICSLWKVDDEATKALMMKFYELWNPKDGSKGLGTDAALKKAQEYVRDFKDEEGKQKWKHPYYWAAWVLWGLPD